jgi:hypothetical protein
VFELGAYGVDRLPMNLWEVIAGEMQSRCRHWPSVESSADGFSTTSLQTPICAQRENELLGTKINSAEKCICCGDATVCSAVNMCGETTTRLVGGYVGDNSQFRGVNAISICLIRAAGECFIDDFCDADGPR